MTKEEILNSSDSNIALTIIKDTFDEVNHRYETDEKLYTNEKNFYKTEGYLDGLKFCIDILSKTKDIKETIKND